MKLLVVGLDGFSDSFWQRTDAFSLVDDHGELETYTHSYPSYMCSITGKEFPVRLAVEDFTTHRQFGMKMIWDYLKDFKQVYLNIPTTFPAENVNGSFVAGDWRTREMNSNSVKPESTLEGLRELGYRFDLGSRVGLAASEGDWGWFLEIVLDVISMRTEAVKYLFEKDDPDVMFFVYRASDVCLHQRGPKRLGESGVREMYGAIAENLEDVVETIGAETVLYFSDHSVNEMGYHGPDHPETKWGTWGLLTELEYIPPRESAHLLDIVPTILTCLEADMPPLKGTSLVISKSDREAYLERMRRLGYI